MKESDIVVAESIETIGLNNLGEPNEIESFFRPWQILKPRKNDLEGLL